LLDEQIKLTGCGRTDAGVHARVFYAHFDSKILDLENDDGFLFRMNSKLPGDIVLHGIYQVTPEAHARFSALSRTYSYQIHRTKQAFDRDLAHFVYGNLDLKSMQEASNILPEYTDFTSFSKVDTETSTNDCRIDTARWESDDDQLVFIIKADRFLRNMVRAIVGTLLDIGFGKLDINGFRSIIESRDRSAAGTSAPAKGLFLTDVEYPPEIFIK
jgi:tRNA pseudouridine38-40 synthase